MPPVALGETDPRRWGADSAVGDDPAVVVGGPHWPRAGLANNPNALDSAAFSVDKPLLPPAHLSGGTYASSVRIDAIAASEARAFIDDLQQQGGGSDPDGRASPGPPRASRPAMMMDPRIDTHAGGGGSVAGGGGGGGGGGGQQGSHFSPGSPFDHHHHPHQQPRHGGHPHARPGDDAGLAPFRVSSARVHGTSAASSAGQSMQQPRGSGGGPPPASGGGPSPQLRQQQHQQQQQQQQHRSPFEYAALIPGEQQQPQPQQPLGRALGVALGPGMSRGRNLGGNIGSYQDQQQQHGQQQHQQQQQQQPMRGSSPGGSRNISRGSPPTISGNKLNGGMLSSQQQPLQRGTASPDRHHPHHSSMSMAALASVPHGASTLPASAVPTVLERFPGFVRCVMDIAPEVVGWVIGRSGAHIKEMKHRSGCGMWVDQKDLKLYITGADMPRIHAAAALVGDLISKAPVNVNSAGVEDEVTSHMIECPPHLIGLLIGRGGSTIKRIKEESRANVVINQKMMKVIVSGIPQSVRLGVAMIEDVITFGRSAEHGAGLTAMGGAFPPNFLDFPGGIADMADFMDDGGVGGGLDRFTLRAAGPPGQPLPPLSSVDRHGSPSLSLPGVGGGSVGGAMSSSMSSAGGEAFARAGGGSPFDGATRQQQQQQQQQHELAAGGGGGGRPAKMETMLSNLDMDMDMMSAAGFDGKEMDWSVFSGSSPMFNIGGGAEQSQQQRQQQQQQQQSPSMVQQSSPGGVEGGGARGGGGGRGRPPLDSPRRHQHSHHGGEGSGPPHQDMHHLSGLPPPASSSARIIGNKDIGGDGMASAAALMDASGAAHSQGSRSSSLACGGGGGGLPGFSNSAASGSRTGSVSSGGTPPLSGRSMPMSAPWNIMGPPPLRGVDATPAGPPSRVGGLGSSSSSPGGEGISAAGGAALLNMNRLSINSDEDSNSGGRSLGQANRERERSGTPVGNPADLAEFLGVMGLEQYARALSENEIDLEAVQLMADSDFQDVGIPKGPRVKLLYALRTKRYPPRSGDISAMKTFLISLGLERYCKVFEESEVDMGAVDVMEESDYAQLGVAKGPRLKMMNVLARPTTGGGGGGGNAPRSGFGSVTKGGGNKAGSMSILSPARLLLSPRANSYSGGGGSGGQGHSSTLSPSQWSVRGSARTAGAAASAPANPGGSGSVVDDDDVDSVVGGYSASSASCAASSSSSPARTCDQLGLAAGHSEEPGDGSASGGRPDEPGDSVNAAPTGGNRERPQQESSQGANLGSQELN